MYLINSSWQPLNVPMLQVIPRVRIYLDGLFHIEAFPQKFISLWSQLRTHPERKLDLLSLLQCDTLPKSL